ncbi:MAG: hypothetical protein IPK06_03285 [Ignavibacteriae bacterium]|nr:hypothetical protein [Ignavibacteriota bacterium]
MGMKLFYLILLFFISIICADVKANGLESELESANEITDSASSPFSINFGADLVSRYIWRGIEFGTDAKGNSSPHFQPTGTLTYSFSKSGSMSLGFWGSYGFNGNFSESDMYFNLFFATDLLDYSVTFSDYYYPFLNIPFTNLDSDGFGAHTIDAQVTLSLKSYLPIYVLFSNNIYNDVPDNKSLYLETGFSFNINNINTGIFVGAAQGKSIWHAVNSDKFEFINVGFKVNKEISITNEYSLPIGLQWIYNHHLKKTYLVFKVTL